MQDDDKLYGLIAQAEDIQKHAVTLERAAQEAIKGLPEGYREAVKGAARDILTEAAEKASTALLEACNEAKVSSADLRRTGLMQSVFLLAVGMVVSGVAIAGIWWGTSRLRDEAAELRNTIATLKQYAAEEQRTLQELSGKTWRLELVQYREGGKGIILPKGLTFERAATLENGKTALIIKP